MKLREFVTSENIALPPIALRDGLNWDAMSLAAEKAAYAEIVTAFNTNPAWNRRPVSFPLGQLGLMAMFGLRGNAIGRNLAAVIADPWPVEAEAVLQSVLPAGVALEDLRQAFQTFDAWMRPESQAAPDLGEPMAGLLLDALVVLGVILPAEREAIELKRTIPFVVDELQAWNELHTWTEGRPS